MKFSQAELGRVFVIRMEHGEKLPETLEEFCRSKNVKRGFCLFLGGVKSEGRIIAGPEKGEGFPIKALVQSLSGVHEVLAVGTIFPDEQGNPILHSHAALGRVKNTITGCIRLGIETWNVLEIILVELSNECGIRIMDNKLNLKLIDPEK